MADPKSPKGEPSGVPEHHLPVNFVPAKAGEIIQLGPVTCRIMEDGSRTDNRLGVAEFTIPPNTPGPLAHWHEMHDETFHTTAGTIRFHLPSPISGEPDRTFDAATGDFVTVPVRAPHTFSNPFDKDAKFINTFSPAFLINYFKALGELLSDGPITPEKYRQATTNFATTMVPRSKL